MRTRPRPWRRLLAICLMLSGTMLGGAYGRPVVAAETVVGPGVVPPFDPGNPDGTRFLAGTEIIAQGAWTSQVTGGIRQDGKVAMVAYEPLVFEGGRYEGASFTTAADALSARGGNAIHVYTSSNPTIWIHDGTFRGGSVFLDSLSQPIDTATGADAIFLNSRNGSRLIIYDGLIEGGVVALKDAPNEPLQRGHAIQTGGWRERSRHLIDVHGGDLVGGVNMYGHARFTVYGSEIAISPALDGLFSGPTNFTITGLYADGTPFSHAVRADPFAYGRIDRNGGSLAIEMLVPEPSALLAITTAGAALCGIPRRSRTKPAMASPVRHSHMTGRGSIRHAFLASPRLGVQ